MHYIFIIFNNNNDNNLTYDSIIATELKNMTTCTKNATNSQNKRKKVTYVSYKLLQIHSKT